MRDKIISFYYKCCRGIDKVTGIPREIKWFIQRGKRGYADCDLWGFDSYLSEMIPKAIRRLAVIKHGCPDEFFNCPPEFAKGIEVGTRNCDPCQEKYEDCTACKSCEEMLIKIAEGFEAYSRASDFDYEELEVWHNETNFSTIPLENGNSQWNSSSTPKGKEALDKAIERKEADFKKWDETAPLFIKYFGMLWD